MKRLIVCTALLLTTVLLFGQRPKTRPTSPSVQPTQTISQTESERLKEAVNKPTYGKHEPVEMIDVPMEESSEYKYKGLTIRLREKSSTSKTDMGLNKNLHGFMEGYTKCTQAEVSVNGTAEEFVLLSNLSDNIFPGARYTSIGLIAGNFQELPENFGTGFATLVGLGNSKTVKMDKSSLLKARADILKSTSGGTAASLKYEAYFINSKEDFALQSSGSFTGVNYGVYGGDVAFNFNESNIRTRLFIDLVQPLYTMSIQTPKSPYDFFSNLPKTLKIPDNWLYVKSVTYGRRLMISLESQNDIHEFKSEISGYFYGLAANTSVSLSTQAKSLLQNTTIRIMVQGGDPADQALIPLFTLGGWQNLQEQQNALRTYLHKYLNNVQLDQAVPLAFSLSKIKNGQMVDLKTTGKFTYTSCYQLPKKYEVKVAEILTKIATDGKGNEQIYCYGMATAYDSKGNRYNGKSGKVCDLPDNFPCGVSLNVGSEDNPVACYAGQPVNPQVKSDLLMPLEVVNDPNAYIEIFMRMLEEDDFTDDEFGKYKVKLYMRDLHSGANDLTLQFGEGGSIVDMRIELKPLYQ